jgi:hypothetical protein
LDTGAENDLRAGEAVIRKRGSVVGSMEKRIKRRPWRECRCGWRAE